jgi:integrase
VNVLKSAHGSVKPYTRHLQACRHRKAKDYNACSCPKWLYSREAKGKKGRVSLNTPSWAEAQRIAADTLRNMDPEIAAARAVTQKHRAKLVTVKAGCGLWMGRVERDLGKRSSYDQYLVVARKLQRWAADMGIHHLQEIRSLHLDGWYSSSDWTTKLSESTRRQRWVMVRSMFRYWHEHKLISENPVVAIKPVKGTGDHVQGPYEDKQVDAVLEEVANDPRVFAFVQTLLHIGCDVMDAVLFEPHRIRDVAIDGRNLSVYRYHRAKTKVEAVVPLSSEVAALLRSVPLSSVNTGSMPFRNPGLTIEVDRRYWSESVKAALNRAKVFWVELPSADDKGRKRRKEANCKQFRHTFAVRQLRNGQRPEEVAKMLGHVNADMVRKHYAPWVPSLEDAYLRQVIQQWENSAPLQS